VRVDRKYIHLVECGQNLAVNAMYSSFNDRRKGKLCGSVVERHGAADTEKLDRRILVHTT
jgi:hypothetical protein